MIIPLRIYYIGLEILPNKARSRRAGLGAFLELVLSIGEFPFPSLILPATGNAGHWALAQ